VRLPEHLFDDRTIDCSRWNYLVMRVKGDHRSYSVNFKTINSFSGDLYSCRFKFLRPYEWEEIIVPFNRFIRTNCGAEYLRQSAPNMEKITSFGFLLADHLPGPYQLDIDWIKVSNLHFSDESPEMLRNLVEPEKKRQDWIDSSRNSFGFGFDMAPGTSIHG
jgi:NADH dehydrogenase [ubiquinone] 1 alpha subcomplex assembly factor 1